MKNIKVDIFDPTKKEGLCSPPISESLGEEFGVQRGYHEKYKELPGVSGAVHTFLFQSGSNSQLHHKSGDAVQYQCECNIDSQCNGFEEYYVKDCRFSGEAECIAGVIRCGTNVPAST
jgi:hypothetical protein